MDTFSQSRSQKIQNTFSKLNRHIQGLQSKEFRELLKKTNHEITKSTRNNLAISILENGVQNNSNEKGTHFCSLCRNREISVNEHAQGFLSCLKQFSSESLIQAGLVTQCVAEDATHNMDFNENNNLDDDDDDDDNENDDETEKKGKKTLSKEEKWDVIALEVAQTRATTLKDFYLRVNPAR